MRSPTQPTALALGPGFQAKVGPYSKRTTRKAPSLEDYVLTSAGKSGMKGPGFFGY